MLRDVTLQDVAMSSVRPSRETFEEETNEGFSFGHCRRRAGIGARDSRPRASAGRDLHASPSLAAQETPLRQADARQLERRMQDERELLIPGVGEAASIWRPLSSEQAFCCAAKNLPVDFLPPARSDSSSCRVWNS